MRCEFAALPNILWDGELVPEIIGAARQPEAVIRAVTDLIDNPALVERQRAGFAKIRAEMEQGLPAAPLTDAASRILDYFRLLRGR